MSLFPPEARARVLAMPRAVKSVSVRKFLRQCHLWLGLTLGGLFAIIAATGSALVFYISIDEALHPEIESETALAAPGWQSSVWDQTLTTGRSLWRDPGGRWSLEVTGQGGPIPARFYPASHESQHTARTMVWFSADGSRVLREAPWGGYLMSWIYELHMQLLAGEVGTQIVGWCGVAMLVLLISGMFVWWPRGDWKKALSFKRRAVPLRRIRDIHKLSGLGSIFLLLILVGTGVLLALPTVKTDLLAATIASPNPVPQPLSGRPTGHQISIATALNVAQKALPDARLAFIDVPPNGRQPIRVRVQVPGDPHARFPGSFVFVDQHTGKVLAVHDIRQGNAATATSKWIRALHDGSIGGQGTRIFAALLGLLPLALFVTGVSHWRRRLAARTAFTERVRR